MMRRSLGKKIPNNLGKKYKVRATRRQRDVVRYICEGRLRTDAMRQAGYSDSSAKNPGQNLSKKHGYREALGAQAEAFYDAGFDAEWLAEAIHEMRCAQTIRVIPAHTKLSADVKKTHNFRRIKGGTNIIVPNWMARIKAVEIVLAVYTEYEKAKGVRYHL